MKAVESFKIQISVLNSRSMVSPHLAQLVSPCSGPLMGTTHQIPQLGGHRTHGCQDSLGQTLLILGYPLCRKIPWSMRPRSSHTELSGCGLVDALPAPNPTPLQDLKKIESPFFFFFWRGKIHIRFTILKWTFLWHLIHSQCYAITFYIKLQNIFYHPKRKPCTH